jgi:hypothetical protein
VTGHLHIAKSRALGKLIRFALIAMLAVAPACAFPQQLEIIPLKHRTVDQVLPVLHPLLDPGGTLSGMQDQLFVRTNPRNLAELKRVLESIDTVPRRLIISVRHDAVSASERRGGEVTGTIGGGRAVISNQPGGARAGNGISARVFDSRSAGDDSLVQQIQVLEGSAALIQAGQAVPVAGRTVTRVPGGTVVTDSVSFRDVTSGFEVVPRVVGDRVVLEISPRRDSQGAGGSVNIQRIYSTVSGRLGEWFELGGIAGDESRQRSGLLSGAGESRSDNRRVWIKVEEIK